MRKRQALLIVVLTTALFVSGQAQTVSQTATPAWTEADKKFLLDNLTRTKQEIVDETKDLTREQWNFKESPDRWSINQIVEHIAIWELLFMREISRALAMPSNANYMRGMPDSVFINNDPEGLKKNNALEFTKPFSFAVPLGNNEGKNNVTWLMTMRNESIEYLKKETKNIRLQYDYGSGVNVHQYYLMIFSHSDRHLRQIRKVKAHQKYPR